MNSENVISNSNNSSIFNNSKSFLDKKDEEISYEKKNIKNQNNEIILKNNSEINNLININQISNNIDNSRKSSSDDLTEEYDLYTRRLSAINLHPNFNEKLSSFSNNTSYERENNYQTNIQNPQKNNQNTNNNINLINGNNQIINNLKLKIQILAGAVKDERAKTNELENKIKNLKINIDHCEKLLIEKEDSIVSLSKEKYELQTRCDKEKLYHESMNQNLSFTNIIGNIFNRRESNIDNNFMNDQEYKKLLNENIDLSHENDLLKNRLQDITEDFNRCKSEYQNIINSQIEKIKRMENLIQEKNLSLDETQKKLQIMYENYKKYDVEKTKYESSLNELTKDKKLREEKIIELLLKLDDKESLISSYKENLQRHEIESAGLAIKLAELKNAIIESNLVITNFQGERIGTFFNDNVELTFGRTEENEYIMIVTDKNGEEYVDLEDIDYIKIQSLE